MKKSEINIKDLIIAYETTTSLHKLGEIFHTSHIRIKKLLIEAGIELKTDTNARLNRLINDIINEYQSNDKITVAELAKKYNIPLVKLRKAFNENGIKIDQWRNHIKKTYQPKYKIKYILGRNATTEDLIKKGKELFGENRYDYSLTHFTKMHDKIQVICHEKDKNGNEHGIFETKATNFIKGYGCPKCNKNKKLTIEEWIDRAREVHGDKYDYSKITNTSSSQKGIIICPEHGEFKQNLSSHLQGHGCPYCYGNAKKSTATFIEEAKKVHGNFYSYDKFEYIQSKQSSIITCPKHGDFLQCPQKHLLGQGCPKCSSSKLETLIINILNKNNIFFKYQSKVINLGDRSVDFYIPEYKIIIECQGDQHFKPVRFNNNDSDNDLEEKFHKQLIIDRDKYEAALKEGYDVIYFTSYDIIHDDVDIEIPFYDGKKLFLNPEQLVDYIFTKSKQEIIDNKSIFIRDIRDKITNEIIVNDYSHILYKNYKLCFHELTENEPSSLNDITSYNKRKGNYKTIHIFEDEYIQTPEIVISKLKHILKCNTESLEKVMARKCTIKEVTKTEAKDFLYKNHIQGFVAATVYLGAYYNNKIIGLMSFLKEENDNWNLNRFASDNNYICSGLGGKLFKYFTKNYKYDEIKTFADRRWTCDEENNIYTRLGFIKDSILNPEYRYIDGYEKIRHHKFGFRKKLLIKKYPEMNLDMTMTEKEMTKMLGFKRIYDAGLIKYVYKDKYK